MLPRICQGAQRVSLEHASYNAQGDTHDFKADGVVYYNKGLLPGYAALFRHPNNELNYCCYLIPGTSRRLHPAMLT